GAEHPAHDFAACDPGTIDDVAFTGVEPLKAFQRAYNANKAALGATAADLAVDGSIGPKTWGAIFDCYQFNMAQELGEVDDEADETNPAKLLEGLDRLRGMVMFLPLNEEWIGFGEAHPADGNRKDGAASQQNRRVEILFFESGQEPDVAILKEAPEITELYSPDAFVRERLPERPGGARRHMQVKVILGRPQGVRSAVAYRLTNDDGSYDRILREADGVPDERLQVVTLEYSDVRVASPLTLAQVNDAGSLVAVSSVHPSRVMGEVEIRSFVTDASGKSEASTTFLSYPLEEALS